jgi:ABC-2 type transport system ATP-binding protein
MIVEVHDLGKRYGQLDAVQGLEFGISEGSAFALVGPNGAGKTTTIKVLLNLLTPSQGNVDILGVDSRSLSPREFADIGYVSENSDETLGDLVRTVCDGVRLIDAQPMTLRSIFTSLVRAASVTPAERMVPPGPVVPAPQDGVLS